MTSTLLPFTLILKCSSTFAKMIVAGVAAFTLLHCPAVHGTTLLSKAPNAAVYFGLPFTTLEFENPLAGTEMVLSHKVLDWRDADYAWTNGGPWFDDWTVSDTNGVGGSISGDEIYLLQQGQSAWCTTTVPSTIVSILMSGDDNDGKAQVLVDNSEVAQLDMYTPAGGGCPTTLIIVTGLGNTTHTITVNALGVGQGYLPHVHIGGAAALKESDIKWNQPPDPAHPTNIFYGWNQRSMEYNPPIAADDWVCTNANPVTKIRWWGSFLNWQSNVPPELPQGFWIQFWTDVPKGADPNFPDFSHPGILLSNIFCSNYTWQFAGWDYDPRSNRCEACFLFEQTLAPSEWFYQDPGPTGTNIYWISISAVMLDSMNTWGWKTRPRDPNSLAPDDAVIFDPYAPPPGMYAPLWWPDPTNSWDLAFELVSEYTIAGGSKWFQPPDLSTNGLDVQDTWYGPNPPPISYLLADDFLCTSQGYLTNITIWGSWTNDVDWQGGVTFTLAIHADLPPHMPPNQTDYSMPGAMLWMGVFGPGQFNYSLFANNLNEWWLVPPILAKFPGDHTCFQYDFNVPTNTAFLQTGTSANPTVYWLSVQAQLQAAPAGCAFGWKTCPTNWQDNATWVPNTTEPYNGSWSKLLHQPTGGTIGMAFRVNASQQTITEVKWSQPPVPCTPPDSYNGWNQSSIEGQNFVADDWACTNATAVTDIHWWGSFIGWHEAWLPAGTLPDAFLIRIWTDVPQGGNDPFSHPGIVLTNIYCTNFTCTFAGWDFDPRNPGVAPEACFKFEQDLRPEEWFTQDPGRGTNIYWVSIAAVYGSGQEIVYPWGWKTRPRDANSLAPDDAVYSVPTALTPWQPIYWPDPANSWDLAFVLTTRKVISPTNDFGDAPDPPYPTLLANDGARHTVVPGVFLGKLIDVEPDGQPNATATGDDLNNLADEDGVTLGSFIIPGELAQVQVVASTNGYLSAWFDFNADGSWATPGDQIFTNVALPAGTNNLSFYVPLTAAQGSNPFARFRFSTVAITNFTGQAPDGEVEDYQWYIEQVDYGDAPDPPYPTLYAHNGAHHYLKFGYFMGALVDWETNGQPNATATGDDIANLPDEDGVKLLTPLLPGQMATVSVVVSKSNALLNAWLDFGADGSWATPGDQIFTNVTLPALINILNFLVPPNAATGSNTFARFRYSTMGFPTLSYTNQPGFCPNGEVEDYRWLINQLDFGDAPSPYPTLLANNGARHAIVPGFCLGTLEDGETNGLPDPLAKGDDTNNLADEDGVIFTTPLVIGTQACVNVTLGGTNAGKLDAWVDFNTNGSWLDAGEQVFTSVGLVPGTNSLCFSVPTSAAIGPTFARFRLSSTGGLSPTGQASDGEVEDYRVTLGWRRPSTNIVITNIVFTGKLNGWNEPSEYGSTNIAADDWVCTTANPVTDIHWWGSFLNWQSNTPPTLTNAFHITIWSDVPKQGANFSHPNQVLWEMDCTNPICQFVGWDVDPQTLAYESCFRFDQRLAPGAWFYQTNGLTGTNIYWLSIAAVYAQGQQPQYAWGWKTLPRQTNSLAPDDAVRISSPTTPHTNINNFFVSGGPIYWPASSNSWDLAFELVSSYTNPVTKWEQPPDLTTAGMDVDDTSYGIPIPPPYLLADDFQCNSTGPLTDITIWGSWTNNWETPDTLGFTLSIHKNVPVSPTNTYSMPGELLWQQTFAPGQYQYQWLPIPLTEGWLTPPANYIFPGDNACFQFDFHVATNAFVQTNGTIYWLDVQAQLPQPGGQSSAPAFGWKTTSPQYHFNDDAVWANGTEQSHTPWTDLHYPPQPPYQLQSIDLAFRLVTSQSFYQLKWSQPPLTSWYLTIEWNAENNVHYQVQATTNLVPIVTWTNVGPELIGPVHEQSDTNISAPQRFYRVVAPNTVP